MSFIPKAEYLGKFTFISACIGTLYSFYYNGIVDSKRKRATGKSR